MPAPEPTLAEILAARGRRQHGPSSFEDVLKDRYGTGTVQEMGPVGVPVQLMYEGAVKPLLTASPTLNRLVGKIPSLESQTVDETTFHPTLAQQVEMVNAVGAGARNSIAQSLLKGFEYARRRMGD